MGRGGERRTEVTRAHLSAVETGNHGVHEMCALFLVSLELKEMGGVERDPPADNPASATSPLPQ